MNSKTEIATVGGGCFWCVDAVFREVAGVSDAISGYSGGNAPGPPTYREVCSGLTGHAEVVQLHFDPDVICYKDILTIFMTTHDPTTLNRQGADVGTQYRSVIYYHSEQQKQLAEQVMEEMKSYYDEPVVTELSPQDIFYPATREHQDYYNKNPRQGYCSYVITPKLQKLRALHKQHLRANQ